MDRSRNKSGQQNTTSKTTTDGTSSPMKSTTGTSTGASIASPPSTPSTIASPPSTGGSAGSAASFPSTTGTTGSAFGTGSSAGTGAHTPGTGHTGTYGGGMSAGSSVSRPVIQPASTMSGAAGTHGIVDSHGSPMHASSSFGASSGTPGAAQKPRQEQGKVSDGIKQAADKAGDQLDQLKLDEVQQSMQRLTEDGQQLLSAVNTVMVSAREMVLRSVEKSPYATLGAAAGVGYVLGGGLSSALTGMGIKVGTRMIVAKVVKDLVQASGLSTLLETQDDDTVKTGT